MSASVRTAEAGAAAPASVRRERSPGFVQGFDGLRAIAALLVIVVHTGVDSGFTFRHPSPGQYFARGEIGVSVFFLISGFLLYRPFVAARFAGRSQPATGRYLLRRALRILPLYWVILAATYTVVGWSKAGGVRGVAEDAFFLQVYSRQWILGGITQAWTLCIEVTFYLVLPLWAAVLRLGWRRQEPPRPGAVLRRELLALGTLYAFGLLFRWWVVAAPTGATQTATAWLFAWTDHFALGMALAAVGVYAQHVDAVPRALRWMSRSGADLACWLAAAGVYWFVSTQDGLSTKPLATPSLGSELVQHVLYGLFALLLLLPAVFGPPRRGLVRRLLVTRVLSFIGLVSYGVYLWHQLVMTELLKYVPGWKALDTPYPQLAASVLGVTLVVSSVTYWLVERPGILLGHRRLLRRREHQITT